MNRDMYKLLKRTVFIGTTIIFSACTDKPRTDIEELKAFEAQPAVLPLSEMVYWYNKKDTTVIQPSKDQLKFVVYSDSLQCSSCNLRQLPKWENFLGKLQPYADRLQVYFIFRPLSESIGSFRLTLKSMMLPYPIYMDTTGVFCRTNPQLPSNPMLHTFLLDENNKVLVVGNPLENEKIDRMFWRTVKEKLGTGQKEKAND